MRQASLRFQALLQTSGNSDIEIVIKRISDVWTIGATSESLVDSGGDAFVTLDVKLATSMQAVIAHGGQGAT